MLRADQARQLLPQVCVCVCVYQQCVYVFYIWVSPYAHVRMRALKAWLAARVSLACLALLGRGTHVAIYGQLLLFCDQSMREKAWRSRKRGALAT